MINRYLKSAGFILAMVMVAKLVAWAIDCPDGEALSLTLLGVYTSDHIGNKCSFSHT